jgi:hypothetical protein
MTQQDRERLNLLCLRIPGETNVETLESLLQELTEIIARRQGSSDGQSSQRNRAWKVLPAVAQRIIKPAFSNQVERIEIGIHGAEDLFREIRIENTFTGGDGKPLAIAAGTALTATFEANLELER